jgi:pilus assembly protein CpaF
MELFNKLQTYFGEADVDEVLINGVTSLEIIKGNTRNIIPSPFTDLTDLIRQMQDIAQACHVRLDPLAPFGGGTLLSGGFRWHAVIPPVTPNSALFSLRRQRLAALNLSDFQIDSSVEGRIRDDCARGNSILVCGPTGCGKTSFLSALLKDYALEERVIILESVSEIPLIGRSWVKLLSRGPGRDGKGEVSLDDLFAESLRMRPDRLIVAELRSSEISSFAASLAAGHRGLMGSIHAASLDDVRSRVALMFACAGFGGDILAGVLKDFSGLGCVFLARGAPPTVLDYLRL